jgi:glyoxylase-like metal-dependent hydrolase (beta-lactamase superfamily II)/rhodanese-related sulfurtransferase
MYVEQLYTNCLAQATYYIESEGEAVVIDPLRDTSDYIAKAKERGATIKYILETHFHADFVSGHIDLAKQTGAIIVFGPTAKTGFPIHEAKDGEKLKVGKVTIEVMHTPGHTPESSCFLLYDEKGLPHSIFTGDTLFVGDVGRPDLLDGVMTKEELASMMYDSLNNKLKPLPDELIVYPAHGPGSACGKNIGQETTTTIGEQKRNNYAMQDMDKDTFIKILTDAIPPAPAYFFKDAKMNKAGYSSYEDVEAKGNTALTLKEFEKEAEEALIIDCRDGIDFEKGFIPNSINVGLDGQFAIWAATVADITKPIVLVCTAGTEEEAITRLTRTGFQDIRGYLKGGFATWKKGKRPIDILISVEPDELEMDYKHGKIQVLDVRKASEFADSHIKNAQWLTLQELESKIDTLDKNTDYYIHCAGGYRSVIASSIMKKHGFNRVRNVYGGFNKIKETKIPLVNKKPARKKVKV